MILQVYLNSVWLPVTAVVWKLFCILLLSYIWFHFKRDSHDFFFEMLPKAITKVGFRKGKSSKTQHFHT